MAEFIVHQHHHFGWRTRRHEAASAEDAMRMDILLDHPWLVEYEHRLDLEEGAYAVYYEGPLRQLPLGQIQGKGDYWFGDDIRIGSEDDCNACGGTGVNHYNPFVQCWSCGERIPGGKSHQMMPGRSSGKIKVST